jgi:hypothetical protein
MTVTAITSFTTSTPIDETVHKLTQTLQSSNSNTRFVIGTKIQEPSTIQITSEWPTVKSPADLQASSAYQSFTEAIQSSTSSPLTTTIAHLDTSPFKAGHPPIVEFVKTDFPTAEVTPELQERINSDFARFESIYRKRGTQEETGEVGLATGWTEEQDGVTGFFVVRGWTGMGKFEEALGTEVWKEGIPILLGWGKPFSLWHVERKVVNEGL